MTAESKPAEAVNCLVSILMREEYHSRKSPRAKGPLSRILKFFNGNAASGVMSGGQQTVFTDVALVPVDFSTVSGVLASIDALKAKAAEKHKQHIAANPRLKGFDYYQSTQLNLYLGNENQIGRDAAAAGKLRLYDAKELRDGDITADNITALLKDYDTAETQAARKRALDAVIANAIAPPARVTAMKPLQIRKGA